MQKERLKKTFSQLTIIIAISLLGLSIIYCGSPPPEDILATAVALSTEVAENSVGYETVTPVPTLIPRSERVLTNAEIQEVAKDQVDNLKTELGSMYLIDWVDHVVGVYIKGEVSGGVVGRGDEVLAIAGINEYGTGDVIYTSDGRNAVWVVVLVDPHYIEGEERDEDNVAQEAEPILMYFDLDA